MGLPPSLRLGPWRMRPLLEGSFRLDGGAMFGVVPRALWGPLAPPDADNTIPLALRPFLLEGEGRRILLDAGIGGRWEERLAARYRIERPSPLLDALGRVGVAPETIDTVILSHLHWDHAGGVSVAAPGGGGAPAFPKAVHLVGRGERDALRRDHLRSPSYRADLVEPVEAAGLLREVEGSVEIAPGVRMEVQGGHSPGATIVSIEGDGRRAIFWDDVVPTSAHVEPRWIMALDAHPEASYRIRRAWIETAADEAAIGLLYHDPREPWGRIVRDGKRFAWRGLAAEEIEDGGAS